MKKIKFQKKLSLNKETVAMLNEDQMNQLKGGMNEDFYDLNNRSVTNNIAHNSPAKARSIVSGNCSNMCNELSAY